MSKNLQKKIRKTSPENVEQIRTKKISLLVSYHAHVEVVIACLVTSFLSLLIITRYHRVGFGRNEV